MLKEVLIFVLLILSVPIGYLIAYMCNDELVSGRKWFKAIMVLSMIAGVWMFIINNYVVAYTMIFVIIVTAISFIKSKDRKWTKRRI